MADCVDSDQRRRRERYRIILSAGLWRGFDVVIEPPTSAQPLRHFRDRAAALDFAEALARSEGWPVIDRTEGRI